MIAEIPGVNNEAEKVINPAGFSLMPNLVPPDAAADEAITNAERALLAENGFAALHYTTETGAEGGQLV